MTALLLGESRIILETERLAADGFLDRAVRGLAVAPLLLALAEAAGKRSPVAGSDAATFVAAQPSRSAAVSGNIFFVIAVSSASSPMTSSLEASRCTSATINPNLAGFHQIRVRSGRHATSTDPRTL